MNCVHICHTQLANHNHTVHRATGRPPTAFGVWLLSASQVGPVLCTVLTWRVHSHRLCKLEMPELPCYGQPGNGSVSSDILWDSLHCERQYVDLPRRCQRKADYMMRCCVCSGCTSINCTTPLNPKAKPPGRLSVLASVATHVAEH